MTTFNLFKQAVANQFESMSVNELFITDVDKNLLWETYLNSFPAGTNEIFRERREYDCQHCKQFIRACGNVVSIVDNKLVSIWDINTLPVYQPVANALSKLVKSKMVKNVFRYFQQNIGVDSNNQLLENGTILTWGHFFYKLPNKFVLSNAQIGPCLSDMRSNKEVCKRGLDELTLDSANIVIELIDQKSLYRGEEHKKAVKLFHKFKTEYLNIGIGENDNYCWSLFSKSKGSPMIRNTAIGTLLVDISDGMELEDAVKRFESKVAPTNYKRPTAIVTKGMIEQAQKKVQELGIEDALQRRYAVTDDITINNVLFANRQTKKIMSVFDEMTSEITTVMKTLDSVIDVPINEFIKNILPNASTLELLVENTHEHNFMSLIAPKNSDAQNILKWGNNFSWSYNGEVTDSIKERVKKAGGNVHGALRCSLSWFNNDDLDIHVIEPNGSHIYFGDKHSAHFGCLDVDMNAGGPNSRSAVENITWLDESEMQEGVYELFVQQYSQRETIDVGFDIEIEHNKNIHSFHYDKRVIGNVPVARFNFSKEKGIEFIKSMPSTVSSKEIWNITTQAFHSVNMLMHSPNHWDGEETGNKHFFFILDRCKNDNQSRGFYNEFLDEKLTVHRKVFEVLGSKMKTEQSNNQLSGLGFSSTQSNHVFCKVTGNFTRTIKIIF